MKAVPLALFAVLAFGVSSQPFSCFPRMKSTPSIKPFERKMPEMPAHLEAFGAAAPPATRQDAARAPNPVADSPRARELGRIYYGWYCVHCHGAGGRGDGAVGNSYVPTPTDLTSAKVRAMSDGELAFAMTAGTGHAPVLDSTVPWEQRWYVVWYVRTLGAASPVVTPERGRDKNVAPTGGDQVTASK
jgi:mono/diheme cytochrome c family protein